MRKTRVALAVAMASTFSSLSLSMHAQAPEAPVMVLGIVTVNSGSPTSLLAQMPTTINATDSEDALKFDV